MDKSKVPRFLWPMVYFRNWRQYLRVRSILLNTNIWLLALSDSAFSRYLQCIHSAALFYFANVLNVLLSFVDALEELVDKITQFIL